MSARVPPRPLGIFVRDLLIAAVLAVALFALFTIFNARLLHGFTAPEILLLEAGAIVLVAYLIARAVTNTTNAVLERHGLVARGYAARLFLNLLIAVATAFALSELAGVSVESILIGAGFAGIVLGLAAQTVLSNVFAGLLLVFADPFRVGDRVGFVSWQYGIMAPTYPHEAIQPMYTGVVEDIGLTYTVLTLDSGATAKVPNGIVIQALVVIPKKAVVHRVRMTFPLAVPLAAIEATLPAVAREFPPPFSAAPPPRLEVDDLGATTWDGTVVLWTEVRDPGAVRDRVVRVVLSRDGAPPSAAAGRPRP